MNLVAGHETRYADLKRSSYEDVEWNMLWANRDSTPFNALMQTLRGSRPPDVFALTAMSAIPIADAIRSYYSTLQLDKPSIVAVRADRSLSYFVGKEQGERIAKESNRLSQYLEGRTVALIDQYIESGRTLEVSRKIIRQAGARGIRSSNNVRWYGHVRRSKVDVENMSSAHADFMSKIGERAARSVQR
ncbi:phosphoribosyltransferase [Candidatus Saccharibacteria bacterium]|nr:phosphoribosyltransferase [Candidatus Saccharibacteria bacterium]